MRHGKWWGLIAQTSAAKIYWALATLVTTTMTARFLGPAGRGIYVAAVAWLTAFSTAGFLSLSQVVIFMATGRKPEEWLPRVMGTLLTILGVITVLGWLIAAGLYLWHRGALFHHMSAAVVLATFVWLPFYLWIENGNGILMALGRLHVLNVAQVCGATASMLLMIVVLGPLHSGIVGALIALGLSQALIVAITLGYLIRQVSVLHFDRPAARELLTGGAKLHLNAVGTYLFTQANVLILNYYRSPQETAYYHLAVQLVTAIQLIPMAVSTVTYSIVARDGPDAAWPQHRKLFGEVLLLVLALGILGYFMAPFAIPLVFGRAFLPAVRLFRILLLVIFGMTFSAVMASQWIARGYFLQAALLTIVVGGSTVLVNLLVIPHWGTTGAAWVTVGTYAISVLGNGTMALWAESRWRQSRFANA